MREELHLHDSFCNLWSCCDIQLQKFGLEMTVLRLIFLQYLKKVSGGALEVIETDKYFGDCIDVDPCASLLSQVQSGLWISTGYASDDTHIIWAYAILLTIGPNFVKLTSFYKSSEHFLWVGAALHMDGETELLVYLFHKIS